MEDYEMPQENFDYIIIGTDISEQLLAFMLS